MTDEYDGNAGRPGSGHDRPCIDCGEKCSSFAGNPSLWPVYLGDGYHHIGCVHKRLAEIDHLRSEIEELQADAGNDAACYLSMIESERQVYEIIGIDRGHDNWPQFTERLKSKIARLRSAARVVEAARVVASHSTGGMGELNDAMMKLDEALAEHDAASDDGWRPIGTAPEDGTLGDLWCAPTGLSSGAGRITDCWYSAGKWWRYDEHGDEFCRSEVCNATHWRPLPPPPADKEGEE